MSNNDKTRQKLVDSIRKTKVSASKNTAIADSNDNNKQQAKKRVTRKSKSAQDQTNPATNRQPSADDYQSGSRIWPD